MQTLSEFDRLLLDSAVKGAVLLGTAVVAATIARRTPAAVRHAIWTSAVAAHLGLPALTWSVPPWKVAVPDTVVAWLPQRAVTATEAGDSGGLSASGARPGEGRSLPPSDGGNGQAPRIEFPNHVGEGAAREAPGWTTPLTVVWLVGAVFLITGLLAGTVGLWRLARGARRIRDGEWLALSQDVAHDLAISRPLTLLESRAVTVPVTWGIVYPVVLLPPAAREWNTEQRRCVLVHEMAHVRRLDALTQLVAQIAVAVFWFNPLMWLAAARMRVEREHACDDYVLRFGTPPSTYVRELLNMSRQASRGRLQPAFAALAMSRRSGLKERMLAILDGARDRRPLARGWAVSLSAVALVLTGPLAALALPAGGDTVAETHTGAGRAAPSTPTRTEYQFVMRCAARVHGPAEPDASVSTHLHADDATTGTDRRIEFRRDEPGRCAEALIIGEVTFAPDEGSIRRLGPGASAHLIESRLGRLFEARITRTPDGSVVTSQWENGQPVSGTAGTAEWLPRLMREALRETGGNAVARVASLRADGGADRVLSEIASVASADGRRAMYVAALQDPAFGSAQRAVLLRHAGRTLASKSGDLRVVVEAMREVEGMGADERTALRDALLGIGSAGDRAAALATVIAAADDQFVLALDPVVRSLGSSGVKSAYLVRTAARYLTSPDTAVRYAFLGHTGAVASPADRARVLIAATERRLFASHDLRQRATRLVSDLGSAHEMRRVMEALANQR